MGRALAWRRAGELAVPCGEANRRGFPREQGATDRVVLDLRVKRKRHPWGDGFPTSLFRRRSRSRHGPCFAAVRSVDLRDVPFLAAAIEREKAYGCLRRQIASLRRDATYWRKHGRPRRAAEIERVAKYIEPRAQALKASIDLLKKFGKRARSLPSAREQV